MNTRRLYRCMLSLLLAAVLLMQPLFAFAEDVDSDPTTHIARASTTLKVRREPTKDSFGSDSIEKNAFVYILELGDEWCKVRTTRTDGYVMTKYLVDIAEYNPVTQTTGDAVEPDGGESVAPVGGFTTSPDNFVEGYYAHALVRTELHETPDERSYRVATVPQYKQLVVSEICGDWCLARYDGRVGYVRLDTLFKWDRIDPYIGAIPGLEIWPYLAFVGQSTTIYALDDNRELQVINPGAAVCVYPADDLGRCELAYERTRGYILQRDIAYLMPVADWQTAQSGDLISAMTTYFAVGRTTLQYQGRNWNIRLAGTYINGTVLQPGENYNMNQVIGPYRKTTGYKSAPIMSPHALTGYGGGTCQVNTTFYNATIQIPLLVTHRRVHAEVGIYYVPQGFDAAVGGGEINLRMQNTLPYAVRYQCFISDGVLTICVFKV